jgi:23S rRNA pseudouridine2605 synthase
VKVEADGPRGTWLRIIMKEGRKRQIREIGEQLGLPVIRLLRVRIGTLQLGNLKPRQWRELTTGEVAALKSSVEGSKDRRQRPGKSGRRFKRKNT